MLKSISWFQFFGFMALATLVYYGWVIFKYYRQDIAAWFGKDKAEKNSPSQTPGERSEGTGDDT